MPVIADHPSTTERDNDFEFPSFTSPNHLDQRRSGLASTSLRATAARARRGASIVIHDDATQPPIAGGPLPRAPVDTFDTALDDVIALTMALTSAIAKLDYADGARVRGELEHALPRAQSLAERLRDGQQRAQALHELGELHTVASRMLMIAPAPSSAAIEAAAAGDSTAWEAEERAWITSRLASGSAPPSSRRRRDRRATRPDSPRALRDTPGDGEDAPLVSPPASSPAPARTPDKEGK